MIERLFLRAIGKKAKKAAVSTAARKILDKSQGKEDPIQKVVNDSIDFSIDLTNELIDETTPPYIPTAPIKKANEQLKPKNVARQLNPKNAVRQLNPRNINKALGNLSPGNVTRRINRTIRKK